MNNKKWNAVFVGIVVSVPVLLMFHANTKSFIKVEINPPFDGVVKLTTVEDKLVVVSKTNEMHIRDWKNITGRPLKIMNAADKVALMADDRLIRISSDKSDTVEIKYIKEDSNSVMVSLGYDVHCELLAVNETGNTAGLVNVNISDKNINGSYSRFSIAIIASNQLSEIATIENSDYDIELCEISVSNDGKYIVVVGREKNLGWTGIADVEQKKLLWKKTSDLSSKFNSVAFSPDSRIVYIGGIGRNVIGFDVITGDQVSNWQMAETNIPNKKQYTPAIAVSNNGHIVAAATEPEGNIYLWDTQNNNLLGNLPVGHIIISGIAFSPDNRYLAASGVLVKNRIKICDVSKAR